MYKTSSLAGGSDTTYIIVQTKPTSTKGKNDTLHVQVYSTEISKNAPAAWKRSYGYAADIRIANDVRLLARLIADIGA